MAKKDPSTPSKSDERNIVGPNQVEIQDIEDQVYMIWNDNKGLIIGGVVFIFAVFFGYQGLKVMQASAESSLKEGYQAADTSAQKAAWAEDEKGSALSGFAFKELGDEAYAQGDYSQAETYYREAVKSVETPVLEAANMALAMTLLAQSNTDEAKDILEIISSNPEALNRAEAQYRLAQIAADEGDAATAKALIAAIPESSFFWKSRAQTLEAQLPEA
ncbi:tetratricopeptide repeat protein [Pelagicoccus sp. SDUM812003]|uniref:tetratricopeptide repeat protein n=1 Tax=Pelagicoccus sp. SDUM812003 TaxID=3041267 RepID=UPI00280EA32D|nr:tetratricopeptide repeat protein [Pelagicoccus sp. SDUM812003]MDQ8204186.1 tetratricopeptide repeat protein [Pelagicoccus sp. SDUM812003]